MLKKIFYFVCFLILAFPMSVQAFIQSDGEAMEKTGQLQELVDYDFFTLFNKSELIGMKLTDYNVLTAQYKQTAMSTIEIVQSSLGQIALVRNSVDLTDEDKTLQINKAYQDIDTALSSLNWQTVNYIYSLRAIMPTITYQRFVKKFEAYYNSLKLTDSKINI